MIRLLHVDDSREDRKITRLQLNRISDYLEFYECESAEEAVDYIIKNKVDCLLSDFQMPSMDGLELLKMLRENDISVPFIFLTGQGNEKLAAQAFREGADDYYTKDESFAHYERLLNSIKRAIYGRKTDVIRKETEEALQLEKSKAQLYLEMVNVIFLAIDIDGSISMINNHGCKILEGREKDIIGFNWFDEFIPEENRDTIKSVFKQIVRGELEPTRYYENEIITRTGKKRLIGWNNTFIQNPDGKIIGSLSAGEDITEKKNAENLTKASEARFKAYLDNIPAVITIRDQENNILYRNDYLKNVILKGIESQEIVDKYAQEVDRDIQLKEQLISEKGYSQQEFTTVLNNKDVEIHVKGKVFPVDLEDETIIGCYAFEETKRIQLEQKLRDSERKWRTYFEDVPIAIFVLNKDGNPVDVNKEACKITGYSKEELLNLSYTDVGVDFANSTVTKKLKEIKQNKFTFESVSIYRKDGSILNMVVTAVALPDGNFIGFCDVIEDES